MKTPRLDPASGYFGTVPHGHDEGGVPDPLRTDPNRVLWTRPYENYLQVDPVWLPAAEGVLYNPGADAAEIYEVSFLGVNVDLGAAAVTISVGVDRDGGGGLSALEYWIRNEIVPYPGSTGWRGPFIIAGNDDVRGVAGAADDVTIHWRIRRVDTGA